MHDLSACILTQNHCMMLRDCLNSIYENTHSISLEVFVVDSGSTDGTIELLANEFPEVKLIQNERFPGFAAANNQALRRATGRYAVILNDDTLIQPGAFDKMVAFMDAHPEVGAVGPYLLNPDGSHQRSSYVGYPSLKTEFWTRAYPFSRLRARREQNLPAGTDYFNKYGTYNGDPSSVRQVKHLMGACILVRREILQTVGLLDEKIYLSFEDQDWCKRIDEAGWQVFYFPESKVIHLGSQTVQNIEEIRRFSLDSRYYFHRKHFGRLSALLLRSLIAGFAFGNLTLLGLLYVAERDNVVKERRKMGVKRNMQTLRWAFGWRVDG